MAALAAAGAPSIPRPHTGAISCALPIRELVCIVDSRSGFVAGMEFGPGPGYGRRSECSRGVNGTAKMDAYFAETVHQTRWEMYDTNSSSFPKDLNGQPNLAYFSPLGALITQMIVLQAANPLGPTFGDIPAIIFRYLTPETLAPGFAVCGNNRYAQAYLDPFNAQPPLTTVSLMSQFVNPLSETTTAFLSSFQAKCGNRGMGFNGGDPNTLSVYAMKSVMKACFTPVAEVVNILPDEPVDPLPEPAYDWTVPYQPCFWAKKQDKSGSASVSCARTGAVVATGKYGVILVDSDGQPMEAAPTAGGKMQPVRFTRPYEGSSPGSSIA
ncbi:hypothetical protein OEZ85_013494 [Tetradesmus obliquus]|uniref:Beta-lactamase-related domain-containing protein n=1 Tax=Tetradesmus obliquus TaxID=3088 RepID=A0ABY8UQG8_TETOB|nr:hypothetical protein OEZ85_013494 [Tetradesmus obliquus]